MIALGLDTSNYTTSAALFTGETGEMRSLRKLLSVKPGELGLRQSDAVFQHVGALPGLLTQLFSESGSPNAVGVSVSPCDFAGSYMPCFTVGKGTGESLAAALGVPVYPFSHQAGHIAAVLWDAKREDLYGKDFLAFHLSGGTTDAVCVTPGRDRPFVVKKQAGSLDLKAGQLIDRVGLLLGLDFPAGRALDALSRKSDKKFKPKVFLRDGSASLSGGENQCKKMLSEGQPPEDVARYCLDFICAAVKAMAQALTKKYPGLPLVFSGGVSANTILQAEMESAFGAVFSKNGYGTDNAAGIARLAALSHKV